MIKFSKNERQSLLDSSLVQLPKSVQINNETLLMSSIERARMRNEDLLKVIIDFDKFLLLLMTAF